MSDFGTDVGNSGLSMMSKLMDALLKLIAKIYDTVKERTSVEYKLKKAQYSEMKAKSQQQKFVEKIEGKTGYINHKYLEKAGVPLTAVGITLDDNGFKELAERCKREGIVITGIEDIRERELNGNKSIIVECKKSDLTRLAKLIDLMNDEKKIHKVQEEIEKTQVKNQELKKELIELKDSKEVTPDKITRMEEIENEIEENSLVIEELDNQIKDIRVGHSEELNKEQAQGIIDKAIKGAGQEVSFDKALDRWTGGSIDKDTTCYVVDAKSPNQYIACTAQNDIFRDQNYIKTTYEVYNGDKKVYVTHDGRFVGRPKDYWNQEKKKMKDIGKIGDLVLKFHTLKELETYQENYKKQNLTELGPLDVGKENRDYAQIIKTLEGKLQNESPITISDDMDMREKVNVAERLVIEKQIENYKQLSQLESEVIIAKANVISANEGTKEYAMALDTFHEIESRYNVSLNTEKELIEERKSINAVQAEQGVKLQQVEERDNRREERVNELKEKKHSMIEYKESIAGRKVDEGAKGNDVKDRNIPQGKNVIEFKKDR